MKIGLISALTIIAMNNKISTYDLKNLKLSQDERPFEQAIRLHDKNKRKPKHKRNK